MLRAVRRSLVAVFGLALAITTLTPATAQQQAKLPAGLQPDPLTVNVVAGGPVDVGAQIPGCFGRISDTSSYVLAYEGAGTQSLTFYAWSAADTTLVVYGADGAFYCDDDGMGAVVGTLDPLLTIANAPPGTYTVWVGTLEENAPALLGITTHGPYEIAAALGLPAALVRIDRLAPTSPVSGPRR